MVEGLEDCCFTPGPDTNTNMTQCFLIISPVAEYSLMLSLSKQFCCCQKIILNDTMSALLQSTVKIICVFYLPALIAPFIFQTVIFSAGILWICTEGIICTSSTKFVIWKFSQSPQENKLGEALFSMHLKSKNETLTEKELHRGCFRINCWRSFRVTFFQRTLGHCFCI